MKAIFESHVKFYNIQVVEITFLELLGLEIEDKLFRDSQIVNLILTNFNATKMVFLVYCALLYLHYVCT